MRAGAGMMPAVLPQVGGRQIDARINEVHVPCRVDLKKRIGENVDVVQLPLHSRIRLHGSRWSKAAGHGVTRESRDIVGPVRHENAMRRQRIGRDCRLDVDRQYPCEDCQYGEASRHGGRCGSLRGVFLPSRFRGLGLTLDHQCAQESGSQTSPDQRPKFC